MSYDFSSLTAAQEWLICLQGWHVGAKLPNGDIYQQPGKRTVKKLIERGLLIERPRVIEAHPFSMTVTEYYVPPEVHMAWAMSCKGGRP